METEGKSKQPCRYCDKHGVDLTCHSWCDKYIAWTEAHQQRRMQIYEGRKKDGWADYCAFVNCQAKRRAAIELLKKKSRGG